MDDYGIFFIGTTILLSVKLVLDEDQKIQFWEIIAIFWSFEIFLHEDSDYLKSTAQCGVGFLDVSRLAIFGSLALYTCHVLIALCCCRLLFYQFSFEPFLSDIRLCESNFYNCWVYTWVTCKITPESME